MKYIAHRGLSSQAPENTIAAFELAAIDTHYDGIECDVYSTKDRKFVVFHDEDLKRMAKINQNVMDMTLEELQSVIIKSGKNIRKYSDEYIPSLEQFLKICQKYDKLAQVEIKKIHDIEYLNDLVDLISKFEGIKIEIISFNLNYLKYLRAISSLKLRFLAPKLTDVLIYEARVHELSVGINKDAVKPPLMKKLKKQGFNVLIFTVDHKRQAKQMHQLGVDYLTTNTL